MMIVHSTPCEIVHITTLSSQDILIDCFIMYSYCCVHNVSNLREENNNRLNLMYHILLCVKSLEIREPFIKNFCYLLAEAFMPFCALFWALTYGWKYLHSCTAWSCSVTRTCLQLVSENESNGHTYQYHRKGKREKEISACISWPTNSKAPMVGCLCRLASTWSEF